MKISAYTKYRFLEIIPGALVWITLISSVVLSFIKPLWVIYFIILFDLYWLLKIIYWSIFLVISFFRMRKVIATNWLDKCQKIQTFDTIQHLIIFPTLGEGIEIIRTTFRQLLESNFPLDRCIIVFAIEHIDRERGCKNAEIIQKEYGHFFKKFLCTIHTLDPKTEIQAKGSNISFAGEEAKKYIDQEKIPYKDIIVSVFDIDTQVHKEYFGYLTYTYLNHPHPTRASYQPVPVFHNNIWDAPAIVRVASYGTTFWLMSEQLRSEKMLTFSSHSMSFQALVDIGFWSKDVVSDDSRIAIQCIIEYNGDYTITPLYIPISMDSVLAENTKKTLIGLYKQQRRWAWGCENIPYMLWNFWRNKKISWIKRFRYTFNQMEGMYSWATTAILIYLLGQLPLRFADAKVKSTLVAQSAPQIMKWIMTVAMVGLILSLVLSTILLPPKPTHHKHGKYLIMMIQWLLLPVSLIFFGAFPAIESQTRLMLGKYLGFQVTKKSRHKVY